MNLTTTTSKLPISQIPNSSLGTSQKQGLPQDIPLVKMYNNIAGINSNTYAPQPPPPPPPPYTPPIINNTAGLVTNAYNPTLPPYTPPITNNIAGITSTATAPPPPYKNNPAGPAVPAGMNSTPYYTPQQYTNANQGLQQATNLVKNYNIIKNLKDNINGINSNASRELQKITSFTPNLIENYKDKFITQLESEKLQNIIKDASTEFGKRLGILGNAILINDNPVADAFFSIKSIFDLVLYQFFSILLFINILFLNIDETVAINNFNSNIGLSNVIDKFLFNILSSVKTISENVLQIIKQEAFAIIFTYYKTDERLRILITKLSTEVLHNSIHNFFEIFYKNLNSHKTAAAAARAPDITELMPQKMMGGKMRKLKTKKQKILKRIKTYLANFHNTKQKSKTLKHRK